MTLTINRNKRIQAIRDQLQVKNIPCLIVTKHENVYYLSGFTGSAGALIITENELLLVTDSRYYLQADNEAPEWGLIRVEKEQPVVEVVIHQTLIKLGVRCAAFEANDLSYQRFLLLNGNDAKLTLLPDNGLVEELRIIKDDDEADLMREAARITDVAFIHLLSYVSIGVTERELAMEAEWYMRRHGAEDVAFATIVSAGLNTALPHATPGERPIQAGDLVMVDMGARYRHYCADMTRTFAVAEARPEAEQIYNICAEAQHNAEINLHSGMSGNEVDKIARDIIEHAGFGEYFGHGTGHGVGLEVHEAPRLSSSAENILPVGAMVTIEPGIYLPCVGGVRIEDLVLVTEYGSEILTRTPKPMELMVIG